MQVSYLQGLIFVVDSNDRERVAEAQDELNKMVSDYYPCEQGYFCGVLVCPYVWNAILVL